MDNLRHAGVGQSYAGQEFRPLRVEEAAVIGGQAGGRLAAVDALKELLQHGPVGIGAEEDRAALHSGQYVLPQAAQADGGIGRVRRGQEPTIFGVHQKEQAVKEG